MRIEVTHSISFNRMDSFCVSIKTKNILTHQSQDFLLKMKIASFIHIERRMRERMSIIIWSFIQRINLCAWNLRATLFINYILPLSFYPCVKIQRNNERKYGNCSSFKENHMYILSLGKVPFVSPPLIENIEWNFPSIDQSKVKWMQSR